MLSSFRRWYQFIAVTLVTTTILFVLLNYLALLGFAFKENIKPLLGSVNPVFAKYGEGIRIAYPDRSLDEINALLGETWGRRLVYEPMTGMKEAPFKGQYVNVHEAGFRLSANQGPWPPKRDFFNVFLFGGSTLFGYGVADHQTIASYLQIMLGKQLGRPVRVYNFGRGHYQSSLERLLFEKLLVSGYRPDAVIFVDGLNDLINEIEFSPMGLGLEAEVGSGVASRLIALASQLPLVRAANWISLRLLSSSPSDVNTGSISSKEDVDKKQERMLARYVRNYHLSNHLAEFFQIPGVFVWQPVPYYNFDLSNNPLAKYDAGEHQYAGRGYEKMAMRLQKYPLDRNFVWCADIQKSLEKSLYVDAVHYSPKLAKAVAKCIVNAIIRRNLFWR